MEAGSSWREEEGWRVEHGGLCGGSGAGVVGGGTRGGSVLYCQQLHTGEDGSVVGDKVCIYLWVIVSRARHFLSVFILFVVVGFPILQSCFAW